MTKNARNLTDAMAAAGDLSLPLPPELGRVASGLYAERRLRDRIISNSMFQEGSWDILLYVYASTAAARAVPITSACAAACVPMTTALRQVTSLEAKGMLTRVPVRGDRRVRHLMLTANGSATMTAYLERIVKSRCNWLDHGPVIEEASN